jgi:hypothetical protein
MPAYRYGHHSQLEVQGRGKQGVSEYLELISQIDVPLLDKLRINIFHRLIFDTPLFA